MIVLAQGGASSPALPRVIATWIVDGFLVDLPDPETFEFRLVDAAGVEGAWLITASTFGTGRVLLEFVLPGDAVPGTWFAEWRTDTTAGVVPFEVVLASEPLVDAYATVAQARDEGVPATFTDDRIARTLVAASREIENLTRRRFGARYDTVKYRGSASSIIPLDREIVALDELRLNFEPIDNLFLAVTTGLHERGANKVEWRDPSDITVEFPRSRADDLYGGRFNRGVANVEIDGLWGFVEESRWPSRGDLVDLAGRVPPAIVEATLRLAMRRVRRSWSAVSGGNQVLGPIASMRTREQVVSYGKANNSIISFTGDAEVDRIIAEYRNSVRVVIT